jgi:iron complex transport system substrate-binding protein
MAKQLLFIFILLFSLSASAQNPERIITAGSAITEIICALGDCDKIIASDRTSLYPPEIQKLPSIGYRTSISAEGIIALKPTLVILEKDYVNDHVQTQISAVGIKLLVVERSENAEGTKANILKVAATLSRVTEGKKLVSKIEAELSSAATLLASVKNKPRVLCVYNRGAESVSIAGSHTFADILKYVGAETAIQGVEGYKPMNAETIISANPDYILFFEAGLQSIGGVEGALKIQGIAQTTAGQKKQIIGMEGIKLSNFGPRLGEAVNELLLLLHPELRASK